MFPMTEGVHMLLDSLLGVKGTRTCITFPHDDWNVRYFRRMILKWSVERKRKGVE